MKITTVFAYLSLLTLLSMPALSAQTKPVKVENPGFESADKTGWTSNTKAVRLDRTVSHSGTSSIAVSHREFSRCSILSEKVSLETGKLYRLSAWVKTDHAVTRPYEQYPTPVAACISMESFPFTNHSAAAGGTRGWQKLETVFIATQKEDRISLNFGYNGDAQGSVWFDDISLEKTDDISSYIPAETVKWYGDSYRFEDKGWIFVHIEGEPYKRGTDYGYLLASEIRDFITKLGTGKNNSNPQAGWNEIRFAADALMLRRYDTEYLEEMKGIADGVNKAGVKIFDRTPDLVDIVALNSAVDVSYAADALHVTPTPLTGKTFLSAEDELALHDKLHKCSAFLATKTATHDKRIVFGQLFMWNGYTGNEWKVITDVVPSKGQRLVYETFPGGIHSGTDFYINDAGIMIGETTVNQTPFNQDGTPQSNRIRKAAQYSRSIDDVVKIMTDKNNGLYTNDWLIGDAKTDEIAILVLGTQKYKLWRSGSNDFYGGQKDWYWSDNNNKSPDVRKEYITNDNDAPYDILFRPVNRDLSFTQFYDTAYGRINANTGMNILATSPINRPHACDGKVTTSEMAEKMMFFAHFGKVTLREKFVNENGRIPDLPGATPHFSLGYSVINPVLFTEKLKELRAGSIKEKKAAAELPVNTEKVKGIYSFDKDKLWHNTVYPAGDRENWFISATAAYWNMLNSMPAQQIKALNYMKDELSELNCRMLYVSDREGMIKPVDAATSYTQYKYYQIPRIKGTYLLHQLRMKLGNKAFSRAMNQLHNEYREKAVSNKIIISEFERAAGSRLESFISQWLDRESIPSFRLKAAAAKTSGGWEVNLAVEQTGDSYNYFTTVMVETEKEKHLQTIEIKDKGTQFTISVADKPVKVIFNYGNDIPANKDNFYTYSNFTDEFDSTIIVYGTSRQDEANHTLGLRYQKMAADRFTETLLPVSKDCELDEVCMAKHDLVILGGPEDNMLMKEMMVELNIKGGKNYFVWNGRTYGDAEDGLFAAYPNPYNPSKTVYLFISNSAMQLYHMTRQLNKMPSWAIFRKDQIIEKGYFTKEETNVKF